ncbi:MAG: leucyl/phenylalanyl-tRNA--protein transferase [Actinomycetota bacterium]|jgi:leucyl/phenylalanyl-tRNA---protein transferase|nr:leucyl/phenylalanyl-tRNA--protein transferase [Actinomycetota bacterium]
MPTPLDNSVWDFPSPEQMPKDDLVSLGADLKPETLIDSYKNGIFPMHIQIENKREIGWWSPQQRGILPLNKINISSSLKKSMKKYFVTFDQDFDSVIDGCGDDKRPKRWINKDIKTAYKKLFELGYVHSVEVWNKKDELVGGLYGVEVNGLFAGESMFHTQTDASKTALVYLVEKLSQAGGERIFDVQWQTPHLKSMGVVKISRSKYISLLPEVMNTKPAF